MRSRRFTKYSKERCPTPSHLLLPAGLLRFVYLLIIHHEPFVQNGVFRGWCYCGAATGTAFVGFGVADLAAGTYNSADTACVDGRRAVCGLGDAAHRSAGREIDICAAGGEVATHFGHR
jgi:hypothetical protein